MLNVTDLGPSVEEQNKNYREIISKFKNQVAAHDEDRIKLFRANTLVDLVKKIIHRPKAKLPRKSGRGERH